MLLNNVSFYKITIIYMKMTFCKKKKNYYICISAVVSVGAEKSLHLKHIQ